MKKSILFLICLFSTVLAYSQSKDYEWSVNLFSNTFAESEMSISKGNWQVKRGQASSIAGLEISKNFHLSSKFTLQLGGGIGALPGNIQYTINTDSLPPLGGDEVKLAGLYIYVPIRLRYTLWENKRWTISPLIGIRLNALPSAFYSSSQYITENSVTYLTIDYNADINPENQVIILSGDLGASIYFTLGKRDKLYTNLIYSYSAQNSYNGSFEIKENGFLPVKGTYAQKLNIWSLGLGYQHSF